MKDHQLSKKIIVIFIINLLLLPGIFAINTNSKTDETSDLLIISTDNFKDTLQDLITNKQNYGIQTTFLSIEDISNDYSGYDLAEKIKYAIKQYYETYETRYVLLIGGKDIIPVRYSHIDLTDINQQMTKRINLLKQPDLTGFQQYISDLYYADIFDSSGTYSSWDSNNNHIYGEKNSTSQIDNLDLYPDVAVGRLLCNTIKDLETVLSKIIHYEKTSYQQPWQDTITVCGGDTHSLWRDIFIKLLVQDVHPSQTTYEGEYMGDQIITLFPEKNANKLYATGFFSESSQALTRENMNSAINAGCGFLLLAGHGYPEAWGTHPPSLFGKIWLPPPIFSGSLYSIQDVQELDNQDRLPIAVISACSCGDFNETESPIAWELIQHENGGAIASFACSTLGTLLATTACTDSLNGKLTMAVFESYSKGTDLIGDVWIESINSYLNDQKAMQLGNMTGLYWTNPFNIEEWILFGDPTLKIGGYPN